MDLEQLTKHQILLLTLLVSFVTSIATGIVTVSLMDQAPGGVTRVVNQIVEHTIEKVVPDSQGASVVTTEKTVVVKDDDLVAQSIATVQKSIIRIVAKGGSNLLARGVILDAQGAALTDRAALANSGSEAFEAILPSGVRLPATVRSGQGTSTALIVVDLALGTSTQVTPAAAANPSKLALGQSVIRIGGVGSDVVGEGVIAALPWNDPHGSLIQSSVSSATPGSVLITIFGEVIGLSTTGGADTYTIVSAPAAPAETSTPVSAS